MNDLDEVACSSTVKKDGNNTMYIDLKEVRKTDPNMAELMKPFDFDNNDKVSSPEIARAAKLLDNEKKMNKKQGKLIVWLLLVIEYVIFGGTIGGLVYGIVKASKDSQVVSVAGMGSKPLMSVDDGVDPEDIRPVLVNTNEVESLLAIVAFVPDSMLPKFTDITFPSGGDANGEEQRQTLMRRIAGIDVTPNVAFTIWTTIGDTLSWNSSRSNNDTRPNQMMDVTLHDGTNYTLNILCSTCTAINVLWDDAGIIAPYNSLLELFDLQDFAYDSDDNNHRHFDNIRNFYCDFQEANEELFEINID